MTDKQINIVINNNSEKAKIDVSSCDGSVIVNVNDSGEIKEKCHKLETPLQTISRLVFACVTEHFKRPSVIYVPQDDFETITDDELLRIAEIDSGMVVRSHNLGITYSAKIIDSDSRIRIVETIRGYLDDAGDVDLSMYGSKDKPEEKKEESNLEFPTDTVSRLIDKFKNRYGIKPDKIYLPSNDRMGVESVNGVKLFGVTGELEKTGEYVAVYEGQENINPEYCAEDSKGYGVGYYSDSLKISKTTRQEVK